MNDRDMNESASQEYADQIHDARATSRRERAARRHAFWAKVSEVLLSIPPGVMMRTGG